MLIKIEDMTKRLPVFFLSALMLTMVGCTRDSAKVEPVTIHVGYFSNITHAQALVGIENGTFQKHVGENVGITTKIFNAGPEEIEALFAGEIDIGYIGPSPALNGFVQSQGEALKIIAGAMSGGTVLVVQPELAADFAERGVDALRGKKIASPQQGNTQDISLRAYLQNQSLAKAVEVIPIANADQLALFADHELDGAWSPEPWASRLIQDAGAVIALDERDLWPNGEFATTVVIARTEFIEEHPDIVQAWIDGHVAVTQWLIDHPAEAQKQVNDAIEHITDKRLADATLAAAWSRLQPQTALLRDSITTFANQAVALDFLDTSAVDLTQLYDESFLTSAGIAASQ